MEKLPCGCQRVVRRPSAVPCISVFCPPAWIHCFAVQAVSSSPNPLPIDALHPVLLPSHPREDPASHEHHPKRTPANPFAACRDVPHPLSCCTARMSALQRHLVALPAAAPLNRIEIALQHGGAAAWRRGAPYGSSTGSRQRRLEVTATAVSICSPQVLLHLMHQHAHHALRQQRLALEMARETGLRDWQAQA